MTRDEPGIDEIRASPARMLRTLTRAVTFGARDRVFPRPVSGIDEVPSQPGLVTSEWLTSVLRDKMPADVAVESFTYTPVTSGTNVRGHMSVRYSSTEAGLPTSMFVKSTPTIVTRLANSVTMAEEAEFYNHFRPRLGQLEIPYGYHSAVDARTFRSIHLIEDLVDTKGATFPADPSIVFAREQAEDAVDLLADVHRTIAGLRTDALPTFSGFWRRALGIADVAKAVRAFQGDDFCSRGMTVVGDRLWQACVKAIQIHDELPATLLHNDPHRGNWYVTRDGRMGLLDWQTVCIGHWSRDLAYAIPTLLTVPQRRDWERDLVRRYHQRAGLSESLDEAWLRYRQQLIGGLLFWAPTLRPPRGFPEMQPRVLAVELMTRISTAMVDHETVDAVLASSGRNSATSPR
ncbi:aminoglycoside phosphotransferase family protein [Gordonia aurantiaca]|uniref:aminoglycoside phosphotransferase family protein n=1 Tax=Gordonia sp. B21 TaxID=3151852 RepID=UPI0032673425